MELHHVHERKFYWWLIAAVGFGVGGFYSLQSFFDSGIISGASYDDDLGYTKLELADLVWANFLLVASAACAFTFVLQLHKSNRSSDIEKSIVAGVIIVMLVTSMVLIHRKYHAGHLLDCMFFCFEADAADDDRPEVVIQGVIYDFVLLGMAGLFYIVFHSAKFRACFGSSPKGVESSDVTLLTQSPSLEDKPLLSDPNTAELNEGCSGDIAERNKYLLDTTACLLGFLVFLPFLIVCCAYFPSIWEYFTRADIQSAATDCYYDEIDEWMDEGISLGAGIRISIAGACLKFWPDVLAFYGFLYVIAFVALLANKVDSVRFVLYKRVPALKSMTIGELGMIFLYTALMVFEVVYWLKIRPVWNGSYQSELNWSERLARTSGQIASINMGLLVLPVARNSLWVASLGIGWDAMIKWHTWIGTNFLVLVLFHMICWMKLYETDDYGWLTNLLWNTQYKSDNWTINMQFYTMLVIFTTQGVLSMNYIRRHYFEVFYYTHHASIALFATTLWHANSAWYYVLGGLSLWFLDRILRTSQAYRSVSVQSIEALDCGDVFTKIAYKVTPLKWTCMGGTKGVPLEHVSAQYAFLNVPSISALEWHPFTISSAPGDEVTTHHIKSFGPDTFTGHLHELAKSTQNPQSLVMNVEGPFGVSIDVTKYDQLVLVCGGIGVTPAHSLFRDFLLRREAGTLPANLVSVKLIWVVRSPMVLSLFEETCRMALEANYPEFSVSLWATASQGKQYEGLPYETGRPNIAELSAGSATSGMRSLMFHCGPAGLEKVSMDAAMQLGIDFRTETFEL